MAVSLLMIAFRVTQEKINCTRLYAALVFRSVITWGHRRFMTCQMSYDIGGDLG